jgi:GT2 family glycosyltransferase
MIGIGIITYDREEKFNRVLSSIKLDHVGRIVAVKDGGKSPYKELPYRDNKIEFYELSENLGVGRCKNLLIDKLLEKGCDHIFLLEDDCLVKNNAVWEYCISFAEESGLLHFNWNDYRHKRFATAEFDKHKAALCHNTEASFSYFHRTFLEEIRFDEKYMNAWEHIDIEIQGETKGFLPPFRWFVSPSDLNLYLEDIDTNDSSITNREHYHERVINGHHYFEKKWGKKVNEIAQVDRNNFYEKMKQITIKYANRNSN